MSTHDNDEPTAKSLMSTNTNYSNQLPAVVTLGHETSSSSLLSSSSSSSLNGAGHQIQGEERQRCTKKELLRQNLRRYGWSPIRILNCQVHPPTQEEIQSFFIPTLSSRSGGSNGDDEEGLLITYISSESGSTSSNPSSESRDRGDGDSSDRIIEPKESYEVKFAQCCCDLVAKNDTSADDDEGGDNDCSKASFVQINSKVERMKGWCRAMSWIAQQVVRELDIPPDTLLADSTPHKSLDLLRVFHYFPVKRDGQENSNNACSSSHQIPEQNAPSSILGSSPHTDWGSLTIVWQDHIGGLQTYCRDSCRWINVPPPQQQSPTTSHCQEHRIEYSGNDGPPSYCWDCIVHIGDMASLVLGRKFTTEKDDPIDSVTSEFDHLGCSFPSPKHRVVNSSIYDRTSLVYFGYPPADKSLDDIEESLKEWKHRHSTGPRLPYEEYYLLQDQSALGYVRNDDDHRTSTPSPEQTYESIRHRPIADVIHQKWQQVQR